MTLTTSKSTIRRLNTQLDIDEMARFLANEVSTEAILRAAELVKVRLTKPIEYHIWVDGGCFGNGTSDARGYHSVLVELLGGMYHKVVNRSIIPEDLPQTNNVAEYWALRAALFYIHNNTRNGDETAFQSTDRIFIHTDSALTVGQLTQNWKVNKGHLLSLWRDCAQLLDELGNVMLIKEPRERIEAILGH